MSSHFPATRREFLKAAALGAAAAGLPPRCFAGAEPPAFLFEPAKCLIPAPGDPAEWPLFRKQLAEWREATRKKLDYQDDLYRRAEFAWTSSCFSSCFVMLYDEAFYDHAAGRWRVEEFLEHGRREFGGYDAIVLWHAYPRIGLDDRNQFDFYGDMPGGLAGLRELSRELHRHGVRVFIDYNPWDTGTRREGKSDLDALAELVQAVEADGIFLDTMEQGTAELRSKLDAARAGVALEGEGALPLERIHDHHLSWAQWFQDSAVPGVLRNKWFERRHLQHQIRRWDRDHTAELQAAWMNGSGMLVWENVFGSWAGWSRRDRSLLRALLPIQRRYRELFCGEKWAPLVPAEQKDVYAGLWGGDGLKLWTLVNRSESPVEGVLLRLSTENAAPVYDLISGRPADARAKDSRLLVSGRLRPRGLGAFVQGASAALGPDFAEFLKRQAELAARASDDAAFPERQAALKPVTPTPLHPSPPPGMAEIPAAEFTLKATFRTREAGFYESTNPFPLTFSKLHAPVTFERPAVLCRFALDFAPVTNAQYAEFLKASGYRPRHPENFLKHWQDGRPPAGKEDHPVVYVDLDDARACARWAGKRLPAEEEWQFAAQGPEGRRYPWGNELLPGRCNSGEGGGTTGVAAFPEGRSPFGIYDLCGNVWEWTESERSDGRTRFAILKGGSYYQAKGSDWYFDGGPRPNDFAAKMLLLWPGLDRCATIGFRCAADLAPSPANPPSDG